jgi:AmmeMemoRadiSam system protein B
MARNPNVAGMFYPSNPGKLRSLVESLLSKAENEPSGRVVVSPHAGLEYSGLCAAHSFKSLKTSKTFVVVGTNHNCLGGSVVVDSEDSWTTPLGTVEVDLALKEKLRAENNGKPFEHEHSVEVQLPFLQVQFPEARFLPLLLNPATFTMDDAKNLCVKLKDCSVIASSDLTHYGYRFNHLSDDDEQIMKEMLSLDSKNFYEKRGERSVCGWPCILTVMELAKLKSLKPERLLYYNSSKITRTPSDWVGYASIVFK